MPILPCPKMAKKEKEPCIWHMADSRLAKVIEKSMDEAFQEASDKYVSDTVKAMVKGNFESPIYNCTYLCNHDVKNNSYKIAFDTVFDTKFKEEYDKADNVAQEKVDSDKLQLSIDCYFNEEWAKNKSDGIVRSELAKIVRKEIDFAIQKKFGIFKKEEEKSIRNWYSTTYSLTKSDIKSIRRIKTEHRGDWSDEKTEKLSNSLQELEQLNQQYETRIEQASNKAKDIDIKNDQFGFTKIE